MGARRTRPLLRLPLAALLLLAVVVFGALLPGAAARKRSVRYGHQHGRAHLAMFDAAQHSKAVAMPEPALWDPAASGDGTGGGSDSGSPFDDEQLDETLGFSLLALAVWAVASALLVAGFIRRERRKALMHRFMGAIHARPDLKRAVEQAAGGVPFPAPPRHSVLRRFLRATAMALVVTLGLNLVLLTAKPTGTAAAAGDDDDAGGGGGTGGGGGGSGGGTDPFDSTSTDGSLNPLLGVVFALLFYASAFLVVRGLHALCCSAGGGRAGEDGEEEAGYAPLPLDASGSGGISSNGGDGNNGTGQAYYIGVPVAAMPVVATTHAPAATAPPPTPSSSSSALAAQGDAAPDEEGKGAPPPYSAALAATPAALV